MQCADLVAVGIAEISDIEIAHAAGPHARQVFDGDAAVRYPRGMESLHLLGAFCRNANRAAVGAGRRFAVDGFGDREGRAPRTVEVSVLVADGFGDTQRAEHGIVELLRSPEVARADHYVCEHFGSLVP